MQPTEAIRAEYAPVPTEATEDMAGGGGGPLLVGGPIMVGDPRYRADLDYDGSGQIDEFELFFATILERAKEGKKVDLTDDVWGCAIYTTFADLPAIMSCNFTSENLLRFCYISLMSVVNLVLQFGLLYWISIYVMAPSMRTAQNTYFDFHREVFSKDGSFQPSLMLKFPENSELCQFPLFDKWFTIAVLFLWCSQCFLEIRSSQRIFSGLVSLPSLPWGISHTLMIHEGLHETDSHTNLAKIELALASVGEKATGEVAQLCGAVLQMYELVSDKYTVEQSQRFLVCLTPVTRIGIFCLVLVPRMVVILALMLMGCVWLTATDRFDSLILNALALEFVVHVDNLLFSMFFPVSLHAQVENLKVAIPGEGDGQQRMATMQSGLDLSHSGQSSDKGGYYRSFFYLVLVSTFVIFFQAFQPVIPGFSQDLDEACAPFVSTWSTPRFGLDSMAEIFECIMGEETCFPYGGDMIKA